MATGDSKESRDIPPGTKVICTTCFDETIEGEVAAFDYGAKVVIIKCLPCKTAKKITTETRMLNIDFLKNLEVTEVSGKPPPSLPTLDIDKIDRKIRFAIDQKRQAAEKIGINVSPEGQRLFDKIHKTFNQVRWDGQRIVIMDDVTIDPPYKENSCQGNQQSLEHIRKIVKKHQEDEKNLRPG